MKYTFGFSHKRDMKFCMIIQANICRVNYKDETEKVNSECDFFYIFIRKKIENFFWLWYVEINSIESLDN